MERAEERSSGDNLLTYRSPIVALGSFAGRRFHLRSLVLGLWGSRSCKIGKIKNSGRVADDQVRDIDHIHLVDLMLI